MEDKEACLLELAPLLASDIHAVGPLASCHCCPGKFAQATWLCPYTKVEFSEAE